MLREHQGEPTLSVVYVHLSSWECILHSSIQRCAIPDFDNGLDCRRDVSAVVRKSGGSRPNLDLPCGRLRIGSKVIIEAPGVTFRRNGAI
jgi:hypothetical protein